MRRFMKMALLLAVLTLVSSFICIASAETGAQGSEYYAIFVRGNGTESLWLDYLGKLYDASRYSGVVFNHDEGNVQIEASDLSQLNQRIEAMRVKTDADDVTYFHFVGTALMANGQPGIRLIDQNVVRLDTLKESLAKIPGRVCVTLDVFSEDKSAGAFNAAAKGVFADRTKFQLLCVCSDTEDAYLVSVNGKNTPRATAIMANGCAYDLDSNAYAYEYYMPADKNRNFSATAAEISAYIKKVSKQIGGDQPQVLFSALRQETSVFEMTGVKKITLSFETKNTYINGGRNHLTITVVPANARIPGLNVLIQRTGNDLNYDSEYGKYYVVATRIGIDTVIVHDWHYPYTTAKIKTHYLPIPVDAIDVHLEDGSSIQGKTITNTAGYATCLKWPLEISPATASNFKLSVSSSNDKAVSPHVDLTYGKYTLELYFFEYGTAKITVKCGDKIRLTFTAVSAPPETVVMGAYDAIWDAGETNLSINAFISAKIAVVPQTTQSDYVVKIDDPKLVSYDAQYQRLIGKKIGSTTITFTHKQNPSLKRTLKVHVVENRYDWAAPDLSTLSPGILCMPKAMYFKGRYLCVDYYLINNTDALIDKNISVYLNVTELPNHNGVKGVTKTYSAKDLKALKPGAYIVGTMKIPKSTKFTHYKYAGDWRKVENADLCNQELTANFTVRDA